MWFLLQLFLSIIWFILIIKLTLSFIFLWYVNEYRFDRMWIYLKTDAGRRLYFMPLKIPPQTPKTLLLTLFSLATYLLSWYYSYISAWWIFLVTLILTFPIVSFWVLVLKVPTLVWHWMIIQMAYAKIKKYPNLKVIGITGSYGKTTVKEITAFLLADKFQVIKTEKSQNSLIAAAELIVKKLTPLTQVMVVEMGAYKKGEIGAICKLVKPQVGVVTAINAQHQDLFGSLANTVAAKYELIQSLREPKVAIFNADNKYTWQMAKKTSADYQIWIYFVKRKLTEFEERMNKLTAVAVKVNFSRLTFDLVYQNKKYPVTAKLLGEHHVQNILAALTVAINMGLSIDQLLQRLKSFQPVPGTTFLQKGINGSWFIDDTFNNNPDAAIAGLKILKLAQGKKYLVMQPMKELGKYAAAAHAEVGQVAADICDRIFLTNENNYRDFVSAMVQDMDKVEINTAAKIAAWISENISKDDAVLFKGKEAKAVLQRLSI